MPRRKQSPGLPERIERIRNRLGMNQTEFAKHFGITQPTYKGWLGGSAMAACTLKKGLVSLGLAGRDRLLSWLADGEGSPPPWLDDPTQDPRTRKPEEREDGALIIALPTAAIEAYREALSELEQDRMVGELRGRGAIRAWSALDRARSFIQGEGTALPGLDSNQEKETQNWRIHRGGVARNNSRSIRLRIVG